DCNVADPAMSTASQLGPGSNPLPNLNETSSSSVPHGAAPGLRSDAAGGGGGGTGKQPSQFVYVFTTHLANTAAEAVLQGRADSILAYHQQNVPRAKLDQAPAPKVLGVAEPLPINPPAAHTPHEEVRRDLTPTSWGNNGGSNQPGSNHPNTPTASANSMQPGQVDSSATSSSSLLGEGPGPGMPGNGQAGLGPRNPMNSEGLSKEQLEHRERSLQTLRDIERLPLRRGDGEKYEEPLQSMISQTQSLGGPGLEHEVPHHPGADMGQQMNMMMQRLNQDSLTPEQVAWRKLQEEYYEEKRRKEEQISIHGRPMQEIMIPQRGPIDVQDPMQLRGGPPFPGPRFPGNQMQRVSGFGGMQNMPLDALGPMNAMQRPVRPGMGWSDDMPPMGGPGSFPQGTLPYPSGQGDPERFMNPRAREEILRHQLMEKRPVAMQRPMGMSGNSMSQGMEMERMIQAHRQMDPSMFAGQITGDSLSSAPMGMDFAGTRGMLSPPMSQSGLRDMDAPMGPGNLNMNMNVNMNMNMNLNVQMTPQQQMMMSQKMRGPDMMAHQGMSPEELARARAQNGNGSAMLGGPQKMMIPSQFPGQGQQGFSSGQGPYPNMPQEMGSGSEMFSPEQGAMPVGSISGTTRLSHIPLPPASNPAPTQGGNLANMHPAPSRGLGRRPSDLTINISQMNSPSMGHLKSPTLSQVHSPLVTSPSANLKSPQTPSQMVSMPPSNQSGPLKSPQVMSSSLNVRSPTGSPSRLKSPSMAVPSPGWVPSPKATMPSPGVNQSKQTLSMNSSTSMAGLDQGSLPSGPRSSSSAPASNTSSTMNPNMPFTSSPDPSPSQNPLSLMMSQMSKYAMPSSTPLYHNAIKTIATSDDELLPDRPMLPP
ncbi:B-cell CLL/lymphoma 9-like, partial [Cathartes aura]